MSIENDMQLGVTREKLRELEERIAAIARRPEGDSHVRELTLRSLKSMVNQFHEEIARYTSRSAARSGV